MKEMQLMIITLRNKVFAGENVNFSEIVRDFGINEEVVSHYYQIILRWKKDADKGLISTTNKRIWSDAEKELVLSYTNDNFNLKMRKSKTKIFSELEDILGRTKDSISYYYYALTKDESRNREDEDLSISDSEIPINNDEDKSIKFIGHEEQEEQVELGEPINIEEDDSEEILDDVISIMNNIEKIEDKNVLGLFKGLSTLVSIATGSDYESEIKAIKSELAKEKALRLEAVKQQREAEDALNEMAYKYESLKEEVEKFHNMKSSDKLKNIKEFDKNIESVLSR